MVYYSKIFWLNIMRAVKMNMVISQFHSNFERVFCIWFDTEICCLTVKRVLKLAIYRLWKKIYLEKSNQESRTGKGKQYFIDLFLRYAVIVQILKSTCKKNNLPDFSNFLSIIKLFIDQTANFVDVSCSNLCIASSTCSI